MEGHSRSCRSRTGRDQTTAPPSRISHAQSPRTRRNSGTEIGHRARPEGARQSTAERVCRRGNSGRRSPAVASGGAGPRDRDGSGHFAQPPRVVWARVSQKPAGERPGAIAVIDHRKLIRSPHPDGPTAKRLPISRSRKRLWAAVWPKSRRAEQSARPAGRAIPTDIVLGAMAEKYEKMP